MIQLQTPRNTCSWGLGITKTYRNNSKKLFGKYGTNLQNPSENICGIYYADKGKVLVQRDQSGAEALIVAMLCRKSGNYRKLFDNNIKPHSYIALQLFKHRWFKEGFDIALPCCKIDIDKLPKVPGINDLLKAIKNNTTRYFLGKKTVHASTYDMGTNTFIRSALQESGGTVVLSPSEGDHFLGMFHEIFPEIKEDFQAEVIYKLKRDKKLRNLFGYPKEHYGPFLDAHLKSYYSYIPQSTVGCLTNIAMKKFYDIVRATNRDWDLLNNKHDSFLVQCPENESNECNSVMKDCINMKLITPKGEEFSMKSEGQIGLCWGKYDPIKNPDGLQATD
jgi:hypothetical protein